MSPEKITYDPGRCHFIYNDGRRCRMAKLPAHPDLCFEHWQRIEQAEENKRASLEILDEHIHLDTAAGINHALANVFRLAVAQRLTPKLTSSLGYIAQLLLCTLPHTRLETVQLTEGMKQQLRRYLETPESLPDDERAFWSDFIDNRFMSIVDGNVAKRVDQLLYLNGASLNAVTPRKRARPRKHPAPAVPVGSDQLAAAESRGTPSSNAEPTDDKSNAA